MVSNASQGRMNRAADRRDKRRRPVLDALYALGVPHELLMPVANAVYARWTACVDEFSGAVVFSKRPPVELRRHRLAR